MVATEGILLTVRPLITDNFSVERQNSSACTLKLRYRRWHVVSVYLSTTSVERAGAFGRQNAQFRQGDVGLYPARMAEKIAWSEPTEALHIHIRPSLLSGGARQDDSPQDLQRCFRLREKAFRRLGLGLYDAVTSSSVEGRNSGIEILNDMAEILTEQHTSPVNEAPKSPRLGGVTLDDILDIIHGRTGERCRLDDLAGAAGLSRFHFSRVFHAMFGASPYRYVQFCRLETAKNMLVDDAASIADVAAACGFSDQSHFSNAFRDAHGLSPNRFREWRRTVVST